MQYITSIEINLERKHPFPYDIPSIKYAKHIKFTSPITFIVGDNGTGKSTLLETIACKLRLLMMNGFNYSKSGFEAARTLSPYIEINQKFDENSGFFFRAEDFGTFLNSVDKEDNILASRYYNFDNELPENVLKQMRDSANHRLQQVRKKYGQDLQTFSHGEAYLQIMNQKINGSGIYLLDEPEAALSPTKQLSLLYFIQEHLTQFDSQFIIATHSPILMAFPDATLYEITKDTFQKVDLEEIEHYTLTRSFLNNPKAFLRHL